MLARNLNFYFVNFSLYTISFVPVGPAEGADVFQHELRGIIPRSFEYVFKLIQREQEMVCERVNYFHACTWGNDFLLSVQKIAFSSLELSPRCLLLDYLRNNLAIAPQSLKRVNHGSHGSLKRGKVLEFEKNNSRP